MKIVIATIFTASVFFASFSQAANLNNLGEPIKLVKARESAKFNEPIKVRKNATPAHIFTQSSISESCNHIINKVTRYKRFGSANSFIALGAICSSVLVQENRFMELNYFLLPKNKLWETCRSIESHYNNYATKMGYEIFETITVTCSQHIIDNHAVALFDYPEKTHEIFSYETDFTDDNKPNTNVKLVEDKNGKIRPVFSVNTPESLNKNN